jgi:primosomal protein N' (replication factor Y)
VESRVNADSGRYARVVLPSRYGERALPQIDLIDLRADPPEKNRWLSPALVAACRDAVTAGGQALLFLNRRGYAPLTLCSACGHRFMCPDCSAWLVEHRFRGRLACHHCGFTRPVPPSCPACEKADTLTACGPGVERIAEEAADLFPDLRLTTLSSDLTAGVAEMRHRFADIAAGRYDIIVGTQLIAKGHHFPALTLVGVVDGDLGLGHGDMRAAERTYQLMHQVVGRAGRGNHPGRGLIQTHIPEHAVMQALASGEDEQFYAREIAEREQASLPPFGRLAGLIVSAPDKQRAGDYARRLAQTAPRETALAVLGPAEAPLALVRGRHRYRLLVKAPRTHILQASLRDWLARAGPPRGGVRLSVDIDPYSFL